MVNSRRNGRKKVSGFSCFGSLIFIGITVLIALLGYLISPDATPFANDQYLELGLKKPGFSVAWMKDSPLTINRKDFLRDLFSPYNKTFNDYEKADTLSLSVYEIPFSENNY